MAFSFDNSGGGTGLRRGRFRGGTRPLSEINIVPLVDVVLVLLIIFMLTASVMEFGMKVDVPKVKSSSSSVKPLPVVTVALNGDLRINDKAGNINSLGNQVRADFPGTDTVYLRADKGVTWDILAQVVSALGDAKLKVNLVTKTAEEKRRAGQ